MAMPPTLGRTMALAHREMFHSAKFPKRSTAGWPE